ncbi:uncharacterized protein LOC126742299 isoform X2 [Anthonomus grandis grandis]|nr:uncharacterized protein LOC126742299 isoform X2 [Anthonomus grandis grandis]
MLHYASQRNLLLKPKNCSTIQEEGRKSNSFSSESFLKEAPTKDVTIEPTKRTQKSFVKPKGKTFVQSQVEKLDKVLRVPPKPPQATQFLGKVKSGNYQSRVEKSGQAYARKNEITCGYMKIMDRVKNNCPHIKEPVKYSNFASDHSWSDSSPESDPELVRFPRETRTAMGQCLRDQRQPVPLSKYSNISHNNFAPAIPRYSQYVDPNNYNHADPDSSFYYNQEAQVRRTTSLKVRESKKTVPGRSSRVKLPCKKNLLCDQGETHDGPCGYTRSSHNRVIY